MIEKVEIGALQVEDYKELMTAMKAAYQGWQGGFWSLEFIQSLFRKFPEGLDNFRTFKYIFKIKYF